eukprot:929287-Pleurochrysis_carterae.AAC.1
MRRILHRNTQATPTRSNLVNPMWLATVAVARHGRMRFSTCTSHFALALNHNRPAPVCVSP